MIDFFILQTPTTHRQVNWNIVFFRSDFFLFSQKQTLVETLDILPQFAQ